MREVLLSAAWQSALLFALLWAAFKLTPGIPPNAKAWLWRLAFLKPLISLLPFAAVVLPIIPQNKLADAQYVYVSLTQEEWEALQASQLAAESDKPFDILLGIWCVGVVGVGGYSLFAMRKMKRIVSEAKPIESRSLHVALGGLLDKACIVQKPKLLSSPSISSAMLVAGRQYAIILPEEALESKSSDDLRLMLAHEVAHIARHDLWWFGAIFCSQTVYFFNPAMWLASRWSRTDHESATDQHAAVLAGVPIQQYAEMLLRATVVARPPAAPGSAAMSDKYRTIRKRLEAMKNFRSKPTIRQRLAVVAIATVTLCALPAYRLVAQENPQQSNVLPQLELASPAPAAQSPVANDGELEIALPKDESLSKASYEGELELCPITKDGKKKAPIKGSLTKVLKLKPKVQDKHDLILVPSIEVTPLDELEITPTKGTVKKTGQVPVLSDIPVINHLFKTDEIRVPILSDIPIINHLFNARQAQKLQGKVEGQILPSIQLHQKVDVQPLRVQLLLVRPQVVLSEKVRHTLRVDLEYKVVPHNKMDFDFGGLWLVPPTCDRDIEIELPSIDIRDASSQPMPVQG